MGLTAQIVSALVHLHDTVGIELESIGVRVRVSRTPSVPAEMLFAPVLHLPFQGRKRITVGSKSIDYGAGDLVVLAAHMPALVEVTSATKAEPYVALEIPIERRALSALVAEMPIQTSSGGAAASVSLARLPTEVLEPALRLLRLVSEPQAAAVLAPGMRREIYYRVLASSAGASLRELLQAETLLSRIDDVTAWLQEHFNEPVRIDDLAVRAHMSTGAFHRRFREITGTTPGAYHKTIRLYEARRQILEQAGTLTQIASDVGFLSPSQFSRDYKRAFGVAPSRDGRPNQRPDTSAVRCP